MNNTKLANKFAEGATKGRGSNMFIEGNVIYSYGYHFPIAIRTNEFYKGSEIYLFNSDSYSNSTAKHKSHVKNALIGHIIEVNLTKSQRDETLFRAELKNRIAELETKERRARKEHMKEFYQREQREAKKQLSLLQFVTHE